MCGMSKSSRYALALFVLIIILVVSSIIYFIQFGLDERNEAVWISSGAIAMFSMILLMTQIDYSELFRPSVAATAEEIAPLMSVDSEDEEQVAELPPPVAAAAPQYNYVRHNPFTETREVGDILAEIAEIDGAILETEKQIRDASF